VKALAKQSFSERYRIFALQNACQNIILNQKTKISRKAMEYTVLIQSKRGGFTATIPILPECRAQGKTEKEALAKVRACAQEVLTKSKFVKLNLPENGHNEDDPWLAMAGMWRDDPTWDEYQRLIKKHRKRPRGRK
jgi:predicted RNase H-like HicB family nuclease